MRRVPSSETVQMPAIDQSRFSHIAASSCSAASSKLAADEQDARHLVLRGEPQLRTRPLGQVGDDGADADHLAVPAPHRVVAREPVPLLGGRRSRAAQLLAEHRLATLEHGAKQWFDLVGDRGDDLPGGAADVLLGRDAVRALQVSR